MHVSCCHCGLAYILPDGCCAPSQYRALHAKRDAVREQSTRQASSEVEGFAKLPVTAVLHNMAMTDAREPRYASL